MKALTSNEIRTKFLDFFASKDHEIIDSAALVPINDPTLLWINCGMAPLKKYFDGSQIPTNPKMASSQKSIRTNDIENVGRTARHHTFFEMLGNFSIGDYFKEDAIKWAWEFLIKILEFDQEKLSITIHPEDDEAFDIWHNTIGIPENRIIRLEDNFWDIGEGPCGPNSEIFYDRGEKFSCGESTCQAGCDCDRYLEIWNLVFSQFNHNADGSYTPLPKKNIDTGMGLERMASVMQDVDSNYEIDIFIPVMKMVEELTGKKYKKNREDDIAFNVIADHIRTVTFAVSESVLPSNEGRGYVIRRLLRRAVRFGKVLGLHSPFLYKLVPAVIESMGMAYPGIKNNIEFTEKVIKKEEERFHETLQDGLSKLQSMIDELKTQNIKTINGENAFKLYDTYGFPIDLTEDLAEENGFTVDKEGFEIYMEEQRDRARKARHDDNSMQVQAGAILEFQGESKFTGYQDMKVEAKIIAIFIDGNHVDKVEEGQEAMLVLDRTPFYAESGGQIADYGQIMRDTGSANVLDVQKAPHEQHLHRVEITAGELRVGDEVLAEIDEENRKKITKNHTATHLMHKALKVVLGDHVNQAGSLVTADRLRFDFSHIAGVSSEEIYAIEQMVNQEIWKSTQVQASITDIQSAKDAGAVALFGEKYGEIVRVITIGDYSIELCGGCHVANTAEIGLFKIVSESGIGAGIRRIEALTAEGAYRFLDKRNALLVNIANETKTKVDDLPRRIAQLQDELKESKRENESLKGKLANIEAAAISDKVKNYNGLPILAEVVANMEVKELRDMLDGLKDKLESVVILLGSSKNDNVSLVAYVSPDMVDKGIHAGKLIKEVASICGGGGGGKADMAQAGAKDPSKLGEAIAKVPALVQAQLG